MFSNKEEQVNMKIKSYMYSAIAVIFLLSMQPALTRADAVTDWNEITVNTTQVPPLRPGPSNLLDIAVVQLAVYDAVQAIERDYAPYCTEIQGASGSSQAAAAKAAHDVLANRFPAQTAALDAMFANYLATHNISVLDAGIPVGATAAACMNNLRANDGSFPAGYPPFFGGTDIGVWRPTTPGTSMAAPWLAYVTPFTMRSPSQFRPGPPPSLNSPEYTRAYNEVKAVGSSGGTGRTPEQTDMANFWNLNYQLVWNRVARDLTIANVGNISDSSRVLALVNSSMADSVITAWDSKRAYVFWRPITAIRNGEADGNSKTEGDSAWSPLVATPPYPDYTSGANNVSASASRALQLFFGTNEMAVSITTTNQIPTVQDTRTFNKFSDIRDEVVEARIYEGIHFRFADELGRKQGEHIAQWAYGHYFQPIK
ncbi:MAG TPA: vanadium-dependent haloperoxidase [Pyrinomonadaceae bacterium]|nr:vanadium-dependent haloperoxidase [Pyrinomonadaceae bacterium]